MATRLMKICDVCEQPTGQDPIRLGWGSSFYEVDLCDKHGGELVTLVEKILKHARRLGGDAPRPAAPVPDRKPRVDTKEVRAWAKTQGIEVNDKGRVPDTLIVQFLGATN